MFHDERINLVSGKIYRNGIIIATIMSFVYLVFKAVSISKYDAFSVFSLISELFITMGGLLFLCVGELRLRGQEKDERYYLDKFNYYIRVVKYYLGVALLGFALAIPIEFSRQSSRLPLNFLLIHLEVVGLIYFSYYFKKHNIYFNYSFINENGWNYYKRVLENIAKLLLLVLSVYLVALILAGYLFMDSNVIPVVFIIILLAFVFSFISLALIYLFISWVEKVSYNEGEGPGSYSPARLIVGITVSVLFLVYGIVSMKYHAMIFNIEDSPVVPVGETIAYYLYYAFLLSYYHMAAFTLFFTYLYQSLKENHRLRLGVNLILISAVSLIVLSFLDRTIAAIIVNPKYFQVLSTIARITSLAMSVLKIVGMFVLFGALIEEQRTKKSAMLIPILDTIVLLISNIMQLNGSIHHWAKFYYPAQFVTISLYVIALVFIKKNNGYEVLKESINFQ